MGDEEGLIVHRGASAYVVMNLYPYNPGHLLICAYRHVADLTDLTDVEREEIFSLTSHAMKTIRAVSRPEGFNLGMNQGAISGAGVAAHIHQHVVPKESATIAQQDLIASRSFNLLDRIRHIPRTHELALL